MRTHKLTRILLVAMLLCSSLANPLAIAAHPMGNFSISHYAGIRVTPGFIELRYLIDVAEIPTYQEMQATGIIPKEGDPTLPPYLAKKADLLAAGLRLELNGQPLPLLLISQEVIFPAGAGGLSTMKLSFVYHAALANLSPGAPCTVHYRDNNFTGHAGWKEIIVTADPSLILTASSAPATDRSAQLSNYPTDLLSSPPQNLDATFTFVPPFASAKNSAPVVNEDHAKPANSGPSAQATTSRLQLPSAKSSRSQLPPTALAQSETAATVAPPAMATPAPKIPAVSAAPPALQANQQSTPRNKFTELISARNLSFWFLFTAALIAAGLGALHALEPGHGKTIVAAYLVGSRGTAKRAVFLGIIVTAAHTAGVYLLGAITLYASKYILPEQLYPWLGMISGIIIAVLAAYLMIRAWTGESADHSHELGSNHSHWFSSLRRNTTTQDAAQLRGDREASISTPPKKTVPLTQLLTLGITGGIVPCPAALVVLLGALSLHRVALGLFLIVAFSLGLAAVLIGIGLSMVCASQFLARWKSDGPLVKRWLPVASATCMMLLGLGIAVRAFLTTGIGSDFLAQAKLPSFVGIVLLGLFLGMRHSTDPDHVVAVSTIASRERSISQGALIGMLWGIGHTLTIFLVGSAIILFGLVIPPRVGLSMEFFVALMLILLGVLNLTGALRWLNNRLAPANRTIARNAANPAASASIAETPDIRPDARADVRSNNRINGRNTRTDTRINARINVIMTRYGRFQVFRPLIIGLVHGLAGSAAVALLVLSTIRSPMWAIAYLLVFGFGTVLGMMLMTSAMAIPVAVTGKHFETAGRYLSPISGIVSTAFGLFLVYQIGFVDGLFRSTVHWIPQ